MHQGRLYTNDGNDDGLPVESAVVTLGNSAPSITSCDVTPGSPSSQEDLTASYSGYYDPNGDPETVFYTWYLNGNLTTVTGEVFPASETASGDTVYASCQPYDGDLYGGSVDSATITIQNAAPGAPDVHIEPPNATSADVLVAVVDVDAVDPDGDAVTYQYDWTISGVSSVQRAPLITPLLTEVTLSS